MMKHRAWWAVGTAIILGSCGGDDFAGTGGQSGSGGTGASAGLAGASGTAGSAGGASGAVTGGNAGTGAVDAGGGSAGDGSVGDGSVGDGGDGSAATGGMGGTGGGPPREARAYVLWGKADTARIWTLDKAAGTKIGDKTLLMTADRGTGWSARDFDALRDGTKRLLWTRPEMGEAMIWVLDDELNRLSEVANMASQPAQGWFSVSFARLADGAGRLLWFKQDPAIATAVMWPLGGGDTYDGGTKKNYAPPASTAGSMAPVSYAPAPDGTARLFWASGSGSALTGGASVWHLDPLEDRAVEKTLTLPAGASARSYTVMDSGRVRIGIGDDTAGAGLVCSYASDAEVTNITQPPAGADQGWDDGECQPLGPEPGFTFVGYTVEDCAPGTCAPPCVDDDRLPHLPAPPARLGLTGLYSDVNGPTISPRALAYRPAYELWSDGALKTRHAYIPRCAKVDTSDMDHWSMPVGSRFWKEFRRNSVRVETRLIHRFGPGPDDWIFAAYQWPLNDTGDATLVPAATGVQNANGTPHDIPSEAQCRNCHAKLADRILSFSAIQLSHAGPGATMASLSSASRLTVPHAAGFAVPGTATEKAALGYLHANCGNCHNSSFPATTFHMRLLVAHTTVAATDVYITGIDVPTVTYACGGAGQGACDRIEPGDTGRSAVSQRMGSRATGVQMPPIGTELVHAEGVGAVNAWILGL